MNRRLVTVEALAQGLAELGLDRGDCVLVHCSLRSFGYVVGGVHSLYLSLRERLGTGGTIVVPSFTPQLHHPSTWRTPDLVAGAHRVLDAVPAFDPRLTPAAREMGVLSETVRALPASRRSGRGTSPPSSARSSTCRPSIRRASRRVIRASACCSS